VRVPAPVSSGREVLAPVLVPGIELAPVHVRVLH
jgi:hypothetical protein